MRKRVIPLVLAFGMACVSLSQAADPNLMGLWTLDDGSGTTAGDSTHKSGDATFTGSPTWSKEGQVGGCLVFNGTSDYCTASGSWQFAQYTLATWFRIDSGSGTQRDLLSWCTANQEHGVLVEIGTNETMRFLHRAPLASTGGVSIYSTQGYTDRTWHHLAVAKSSTTMTLFIDGVQAATGADSSAFNAPVTRLFMGVLDARAMRFLPGVLDDVRIYNRALTADELPSVMKGVENTGVAAGASPKAGATDVPRDAVLGWKAGQFAKTHDVYFGTVLADVNNASRTASAGVLASQGQDANSFDPEGPLAFGQTYYWRVDEVNAAPDSTIFEGATWSFTAETYGYPVTPVKATASSSLTASMGPDKTIDGSGFDSLDQHGTSSTQMWMSKKVTSGTPLWIQYEFDKVYKLYQMWVWNSNQAVEMVTGFGAKAVTIETSLDGTTWTALANVPEFNQATGEPNYVHNTTVDFTGTQAKFVKLTVTSNWADGNRQASLSEVRFFYVPVKAFSPTPAVGDTGVALDAILNWRPGREAARHEVMISTDANVVANGTAPVKTATGHTFSLAGLGCEYGQTYYWKVNEVNDAAATKSWTGDVWSFTTVAFGVVDNFEAYDEVCNRIFFGWVDGFGHNGSTDCGVAPSLGNATGSTVGNINPPFAERSIVHGGSQAMPMVFDNTKSPFYSEAQHEWQTAQSWTGGGANTLTVWLRGDATSFLETSAGTIVMNGTGTDIWNASDQFRFAYKTLKGNGSIVAKVESVSNTNEWAKAGVMIREAVTSGSRHAFVAATPTASHGVSYQRRIDTDVASNQSTDIASTPLPQWVKVTRNGTAFTAQYSSDGKTWTDIATTTAVSITMPNDVLIGLAVTSHLANAVCGAKFSNVSTTGTVSGQWQIAEVGATQAAGNTAETFYVAVQDGTGKTAVVSNPDKTVIATGIWQQWDIPLSQFGVNVGAIKKMIVGVGERSSPKTGGAGKLYIDDIRLTRVAK